MAKGSVILFYPSYENIGQWNWFPFPYLYIAPFLEKAGFNAMVIDARVEPEWRARLSKSVSGAICVGITSMTGPDIKDAIEAAKICKAAAPKIPVIWGGPHATVEAEQTARLDCVDAAVRGQGEQVIVDIANKIYNNKEFRDTPALTYRKEGVIYQNNNPEPISFDYDIFPAFYIIDIEKYRSPNNIVSTFTARGCPFRCTFCTTGKQCYSERKFEQVKKEILFLVNNLKFKNIFFQDGTYFIKKKRVMEIANWLIEAGLNIKWKAKARANSLLDYSEKEFSILKKSGLVSLFFGLESGSERVLKNMKKNTKPDDAEKIAEICLRYDIEFYISFMFATPGETIDDLVTSIAHIKRLKEINPKTIIQNCIYIPLPGTPMYKQACRYGYTPPSILEDWAQRSISSRFEQRNDITWIPSKILKRYIEIYNEEFRNYQHLYEREREGTYISVFRKKSSKRGIR